MCKAIKDLIAEGVEDGIQLTKNIYRLYLQGKSITQIANECGIMEERVKYVLEDLVA